MSTSTFASRPAPASEPAITVGGIGAVTTTSRHRRQESCSRSVVCTKKCPGSYSTRQVSVGASGCSAPWHCGQVRSASGTRVAPRRSGSPAGLPPRPCLASSGSGFFAGFAPPSAAGGRAAPSGFAPSPRSAASSARSASVSFSDLRP